VRTKVMDPIVDAKTFAQAQRAFRSKRTYGLSEPEMLRSLKRLFREKKTLSQAIINECPYTPSAHAYWAHFGSLPALYRRVGFTCPPTGTRGRTFSDDELLDGIRRLHATFGYITIALIDRDRDLPTYKGFTKRFGSMLKAYGLAGFPMTKSESNSAARRRDIARSRVSEQRSPDTCTRSRRPYEGVGRFSLPFAYSALVESRIRSRPPPLARCRASTEVRVPATPR
jgi:hypothetical protein